MVGGDALAHDGWRTGSGEAHQEGQRSFLHVTQDLGIVRRLTDLMQQDIRVLGIPVPGLRAEVEQRAEYALSA